MLWDALLDDIVVHGAKLLTDPGLYFTPEADLSFGLNGWRVHYLIFPPVRIRGRLFEVNWFTRRHFSSSPIADPSLPKHGVPPSRRFGNNAVPSHWFLRSEHGMEPFLAPDVLA